MENNIERSFSMTSLEQRNALIAIYNGSNLPVIPPQIKQRERLDTNIALREVYCRQCKHAWAQNTFEGVVADYYCGIKQRTTKTPTSLEHEYLKCKEGNADNDCNLWEPRLWYQDISPCTYIAVGGLLLMAVLFPLLCG